MKSEIHLLMMWNSNINFFVFKIVFFLFCFATANAHAYDSPTKKSKLIKYDSSGISIKKIPSTELNKLRNDIDYSYSRIHVQPKTAWERFKEWFWYKISELFDTKSGSITIKIVRYVFLLITIILVIFLILKNKVGGLFYGKSASVSPDFLEIIEDIQEINFDKRIAEEVSKEDFRRAIRLYFLKIIKELNEHRLISWKIDKTNADYLKELRDSDYHKHFKELSRLYEYIWYGDFKLDKANFLIAMEKFNQFKINHPV